MFANHDALKTLVLSDPSASDAQKSHVMAAIESDVRKTLNSNGVPLIVDFDEAARLMGINEPNRRKRRCIVSRLVNNGVIVGWYSGPNEQRAQGVVYSSIVDAVENRSGKKEKYVKEEPFPKLHGTM